MRRLRKLIRAFSDRGSNEAFVLARMLFGRLYTGRYPLYWPDLAWLGDEPFWKLLGSFGEADGLNAQRRWFLREAAAHCVGKIGGNTAECGSFMGLGSFLICEAHRRNPQRARHYIFDSFEGLSRPTDADGAYWRAGDLAVSEAEVRRRLAGFDFVECKKGWIPERFAEVAHEDFCFVHVDVDLAEPTDASLRFFFPRLRRGGWIIIDDYGFGTCPGATEVVGKFVAGSASVSLIALPAGGAALVKLD
jgi:hypothetical protein